MTTQLHVQRWGSGTPAVLVHGSLSGGDESWKDQVPLASAGYELLVPDRQCYGGSPDPGGEDFLRDSQDLLPLLAGGVHLVGHSYGAVAAMFAAAKRSEDVRSLVLVEPPAYTVALEHPAVAAMVEAQRSLWARESLTDREFLEPFLEMINVDPDSLPPKLLDRMSAGVPQMRHGRRVWDAELPLEQLDGATFPIAVVSGDHHPAFEAMAQAVAARVGARHVRIKGGGHEVQGTGEDFNSFLLEFWGSVDGE